MTKMTKAQRTAILRAHNNGGTEAAGTAIYWSRGRVRVPRRTADVLAREGWVSGDALVTTAGLIAAGVDMDAIHGEAIRENNVRDADAASAERLHPSYKLFNRAVREGKSYRAALDILHAEALIENGPWTNRLSVEGRQAVRDAIHGEALVEDFLRRPSMVRAQEIGAAERQRAAEKAETADRDRARAMVDEGWGQPDGMLGPTEAQHTRVYCGSDRAHEPHGNCGGSMVDAPCLPAANTPAEARTAIRINLHGRSMVVLKSTTTDRWSLNGSMITWQTLMDICGGIFIDLDYVTANTPAEARTGTSDRMAAALDELAELRDDIVPSISTIGNVLARHLITQHLDRIVSILRGEGGV